VKFGEGLWYFSNSVSTPGKAQSNQPDGLSNCRPRHWKNPDFAGCKPSSERLGSLPVQNLVMNLDLIPSAIRAAH